MLSSVDLNTVSQELYKKSVVKTEEQIKGLKVVVTETNFREKMEELRKKIRLEKENLSRKTPQSSSNKRKLKKW